MEYTVIKTLWNTYLVIYRDYVIEETKSEKRARLTAERMEKTL